jgi:hypothetical protein
MGSSKKTKKRFRVGNLFLLFFCFILAIFSWHAIRKNLGLELSVSNIGLEVEVPEGWVLQEQSADRINILFRGSREDIRYLNSSQLHMAVPVSQPSGDQEIHIPLSEVFLQNPTPAKPIRFTPDEIVIKLDQLAERVLPIKASSSGNLPEGFELDKMTCTPATVRLSGPRRELEPIQTLYTESVNISGRQSSFKENLRVALPPNTHIKADPSWVSTQFEISRHNVVRELGNIPVYILCKSGETRQITVLPKAIQITLSGSKYRMDALQADDLFVFVDCVDLSESTTYQLSVSAQLPSGVRLVKTNPSVVQVEIKTP